MLREWQSGQRFYFEVLPPDAATLQLGDVVEFTQANLPRAEGVRVVGRFVPLHSPPQRGAE